MSCDNTAKLSLRNLLKWIDSSEAALSLEEVSQVILKLHLTFCEFRFGELRAPLAHCVVDDNTDVIVELLVPKSCIVQRRVPKAVVQERIEVCSQAGRH